VFPSAPEVEIYAPNILFVGRQVTIEAVVTAEKETKVDFIDVRVTGHQGWRIGSGKSQIVSRAIFPDLVARVMKAGVLSPGRQAFAATFALPEGMPPSHYIDPAWAYLELKVHVSIPWWPDGRYKFRLPVRLQAPAQITRQPVALRNTAAADEPRLEISLASSRLVAGEVVVGSCAVFHLDDRKPRELELSLVPSFTLIRHGRIRERRGNAISMTLTIPAGGAGTSVPFRFALPGSTTPSFACATHALAWWLVARTGSFFSRKVDLAIPLEIVDASAAARTAKLEHAPILSDQRVAAAFERFAAEQGWHQVGSDEGILAVERDSLRIAYDYRGKDGTFIVSRVACSLGLGLSVTPSSSFRELLSRDIEIDVAEWDRGHHVTARSTTQAVPYLTDAVPAVLAAQGVLGPLVRWTDSELVFERAITSVGNWDLDAIAAALARLAASLAAVSIAPPAEVSDLEAWRRLAERLRGELTIGDVSIEGQLDLAPVDVWLEFDAEGAARRVHAQVGDPSHASELMQPTQLEDAFPVEQLRYQDGIVSGSLSIDGTVDAERTGELVEALRRVLAQLEPATGPYR